MINKNLFYLLLFIALGLLLYQFEPVKQQLALVLPPRFVTANKNVDPDFVLFWREFQAAVKNNDKEKVSEMTVFPLAGADYQVNRFDGPGLLKDEFLKNYDDIFDQTSSKAILSASVNDLKPNSFGAQGPIGQRDALVLPVNYNYGDETESGQYFGFAKDKKGSFKLIFIVWAD